MSIHSQEENFSSTELYEGLKTRTSAPRSKGFSQKRSTTDSCEIIQSIDYYSTPFQKMRGLEIPVATGAILLNQKKQILGIIPPHLSIDSLHETLKSWHHMNLRAKMDLSPSDYKNLVSELLSFLTSGSPLPNVFSSHRYTLDGFSDFQMQCYKTVSMVPHGETRCYQWLSQKIRKPGSELAVGSALKSNPFPFLIPCHRIIRKNGHIGGFCGTVDTNSWPVQLKRWLLENEARHRQPSLFDGFL